MELATLRMPENFPPRRWPCGQHILLHSVIDYHKGRVKELNVTYVDVSKAFDSIVLAAGRLGMPGLLLRYLSNLCKRNTVCLK